MQPRILIVKSFYPEFLDEHYASDPSLSELDAQTQLDRLQATGFGVGDADSIGLREAGWVCDEVVVNADPLQQRWAAEHDIQPDGNVHDRRRHIVAAQVAHHRPDVLLVFEWFPLGDTFLAEIKPNVRLLVGQIASPLRPERSYDAYDLMLSSWPPIVEHFRATGVDARPLALGFDPRALNRMSAGSNAYDVTFVGGFAPSHPNRAAWLERLLKDVRIDVFGYGLDQIPRDSAIHAHHRGAVWGTDMLQVLHDSRITLNLHAMNDVRGTVATDVANNLRLFEATGVRACLVTESKSNLADLFEPGREVVTYDGWGDCVDKIRYYLDHESERAAIAAAGQRRTLADHTWGQRMKELASILESRLQRPDAL